MTTFPTTVPTSHVRHPLAAVIGRLARAGLLVSVGGNVDQSFDHLAFDSRGVGPGGLFVAIRGAQTDGHQFIDKAVQNGATALVCEAAPAGPLPVGVACIRVTHARRALALLASSMNGDPSRSLTMVGVTGTNGKTTTAWLIAQALERLGRPSGFIGTIGAGRPGYLKTSTHTTPDAVSLHADLSSLVDDGCVACVMEVSSHALDQDRVYGIDYEVAVFTNLTRDHLDYHPDEQAYLNAKKRLFDDLDATAHAVVNADDPASSAMLSSCRAMHAGFGTGADAEIAYAVLQDGISGLSLEIDGGVRQFRLSGRFNAANLAAAYSALRSLGIDRDPALDALATALPAPGRFEVLRRTGDRAAVVDYAHTPDALKNVLAAARELVPTGGRLWCVFGCGGDRDRGKRPLMGAIAETWADRVVVTSDNPRSEDPETILFDVRIGMRRPEEAAWIVDRREAIRSAVAAAASGDVVVVAGKGHETYQVVGTDRLPFDDREEILDAFAAI